MRRILNNIKKAHAVVLGFLLHQWQWRYTQNSLRNTNALDKLEDFCSRLGANFYKLPCNQRSICIEHKSWTVPTTYITDDNDTIIPFRAGDTLDWQVLNTRHDQL